MWRIFQRDKMVRSHSTFVRFMKLGERVQCLSVVYMLLELRIRWAPNRNKGEPEVVLSHLGDPENSNPLNIK